jgi:hypothetical protein
MEKEKSTKNSSEGISNKKILWEYIPEESEAEKLAYKKEVERMVKNLNESSD